MLLCDVLLIVILNCRKSSMTFKKTVEVLISYNEAAVTTAWKEEADIVLAPLDPRRLPATLAHLPPVGEKVLAWVFRQKSGTILEDAGRASALLQAFEGSAVQFMNGRSLGLKGLEELNQLLGLPLQLIGFESAFESPEEKSKFGEITSVQTAESSRVKVVFTGQGDPEIASFEPQPAWGGATNNKRRLGRALDRALQEARDTDMYSPTPQQRYGLLAAAWPCAQAVGFIDLLAVSETRESLKVLLPINKGATSTLGWHDGLLFTRWLEDHVGALNFDFEGNRIELVGLRTELVGFPPPKPAQPAALQSLVKMKGRF